MDYVRYPLQLPSNDAKYDCSKKNQVLGHYLKRDSQNKHVKSTNKIKQIQSV